MKACPLGELDESPLSAAILKADLMKPGFNGDVRYINRLTGLEDMDAVNGDDVDVAPGVDVKVYAPGFRNGFDLLFTQDGRLFATDNGPNKNFGVASLGPDINGVEGIIHPDEVNYIKEGFYYGHPNRNRGRTDSRQNIYYDHKAATIPGVFEQCITALKSSSNGIDEYRSAPFKGAMRGQLIVQKFKQQTFNIKLKEDGVSIDKVFDDVIPPLNSLDVVVGPGGSLVGTAYGERALYYTLPTVPNEGTVIYDIYPFRVRKDRGGTFTISGHGFSKIASFELFIGTRESQGEQ